MNTQPQSKPVAALKTLLGMAGSVAVFVVIVLIVFGLANFVGRFQLWLNIGSGLLILLQLALAFLAIVRPARRFIGAVMSYASLALGLVLFLRCLFVAYVLWGLMSVIIGLFFAGIGVLPVALLACMFKGEWSVFFDLLLVLFVVIASFFFACWASASAAASVYEKELRALLAERHNVPPVIP